MTLSTCQTELSSDYCLTTIRRLYHFFNFPSPMWLLTLHIGRLNGCFNAMFYQSFRISSFRSSITDLVFATSTSGTRAKSLVFTVAQLWKLHTIYYGIATWRSVFGIFFFPCALDFLSQLLVGSKLCSYTTWMFRPITLRSLARSFRFDSSMWFAVFY